MSTASVDDTINFGAQRDCAHAHELRNVVFSGQSCHGESRRPLASAPSTAEQLHCNAEAKFYETTR